MATPKTAGKYHAYATEYPEYGGQEVLSTLPVPKHSNRFVPSDTGGESKAGAGRGVVNPSVSKSERTPAVEEAIQEMQDAKDRKKISDMGYKKGGSVKSSSASSRADGIAQRGKTRGMMVMCGGGMAKRK